MVSRKTNLYFDDALTLEWLNSVNYGKCMNFPPPHRQNVPTGALREILKRVIKMYNIRRSRTKTQKTNAVESVHGGHGGTRNAHRVQRTILKRCIIGWLIYSRAH